MAKAENYEYLESTEISFRNISYLVGINIMDNDLKQIILRLEKLDEDKQDVQEDINEVLKEAKSKGYDIKIIQMLIKERKIEVNKLEEQQSLLETYREVVARVVSH